MSFRVIVLARKDPDSYKDSLRFATRDEAQKSGELISSRWKRVECFYVVESKDDVNYEFGEFSELKTVATSLSRRRSHVP
jgi:hypothetical protein